MPQNSVIAKRPAQLRSKVTNGRRTFVEGDGKSAWARRWRDIVALHSEDLGGEAFLSEAQASLIRRAAALETELEKLEGQMSQGVDVDLDKYARTASHLRRILETLGITRAQKDVTPSIADLIAEHARKEAAQ